MKMRNCARVLGHCLNRGRGETKTTMTPCIACGVDCKYDFCDACFIQRRPRCKTENCESFPNFERSYCTRCIQAYRVTFRPCQDCGHPSPKPQCVFCHRKTIVEQKKKHHAKIIHKPKPPKQRREPRECTGVNCSQLTKNFKYCDSCDEWMGHYEVS